MIMKTKKMPNDTPAARPMTTANKDYNRKTKKEVHEYFLHIMYLFYSKINK